MNIAETCRELRRDATQAAFDQRVMLVASIICLSYGVPDIDETRDVIEAAKNFKFSFVTGNQTTLTNKPSKKK